MPAGFEDLADALLLRLGERLVGVGVEHLGEAEDGVERRAELVAHSSEELGLGLVRVLGLLFRQTELLLEPRALGERGSKILRLLLEARDLFEERLARPIAVLHRAPVRSERSVSWKRLGFAGGKDNHDLSVSTRPRPPAPRGRGTPVW